MIYLPVNFIICPNCAVKARKGLLLDIYIDALEIFFKFAFGRLPLAFAPGFEAHLVGEYTQFGEGFADEAGIFLAVQRLEHSVRIGGEDESIAFERTFEIHAQREENSIAPRGAEEP